MVAHDKQQQFTMLVGLVSKIQGSLLALQKEVWDADQFPAIVNSEVQTRQKELHHAISEHHIVFFQKLMASLQFLKDEIIKEALRLEKFRLDYYKKEEEAATLIYINNMKEQQMRSEKQRIEILQMLKQYVKIINDYIHLIQIQIQLLDLYQHALENKALNILNKVFANMPLLPENTITFQYQHENQMHELRLNMQNIIQRAFHSIKQHVLQQGNTLENLTNDAMNIFSHEINAEIKTQLLEQNPDMHTDLLSQHTHDCETQNNKKFIEIFNDNIKTIIVDNFDDVQRAQEISQKARDIYNAKAELISLHDHLKTKSQEYQNQISEISSSTTDIELSIADIHEDIKNIKTLFVDCQTLTANIQQKTEEQLEFITDNYDEDYDVTMESESTTLPSSIPSSTLQTFKILNINSLNQNQLEIDHPAQATTKPTEPANVNQNDEHDINSTAEATHKPKV